MVEETGTAPVSFNLSFSPYFSNNQLLQLLEIQPLAKYLSYNLLINHLV